MTVSIGTIIVCILIAIAIFMLPRWEHAKRWGYGWWPSGIAGALLIFILFSLIIDR